jgi:acyl-CoA reductase-like NAD-dependent aldehyde dehydrogenase
VFRLHAEDAVRLHGETLPSRDNSKRMFTFHRAVGIWGIITPWNFPLLMFSEFAAPGLATGNALVVKPPTHTPLTVLAAMEALVAAGVPEGLVNILPGDGALGDALVRHPGVHAIGFIGSSATGAKIQAAAGLKRSIMECSGNGPLVVLADADLDAAAKAAVDGAYPCAGQVCCATERVIVHAGVHDAFVDAVLREAERVVLGDPFDDEDDLLRIANDDALGLQGAVFTRSMTSAFRFIEEMEVGQVVVNESNNWWDINTRFGGAGARSTGWGRIGGKWTLLDMTDTRTGVISL